MKGLVAFSRAIVEGIVISAGVASMPVGRGVGADLADALVALLDLGVVGLDR